MPRIARTPRSNACFTFLISVTVSASSTSSAGASRPVAMMFTEGGRLRMTSTTSGIGIQPQFIGYVISSRTTRPSVPDWIFTLLTVQAYRAIASVRSMFLLSQVKPSPIVSHSTPRLVAAYSAPTFHFPDFTNWMTHTFQPRATARMAVPNAAVDFPFPSPVFTITIEGALLVARAGPSVGTFCGSIGADPNASRGSLRAVSAYTGLRSRLSLCPGAAPSPATGKQAHDQEQDHRARERHDHLADDRVADHLHVDVEDARQEAADERADDPDDDVAEQPQPVAQRDAAGEKARHQPDETPDQDCVQIEVDRGTVDGK